MNPFEDNAAPILHAAGIAQDQKAQLWDEYAESLDHIELAQRLAPVPVDDSLKAALIDAKQKEFAQADPIDRVISAVRRLGSMPPAVLDAAEKNPRLDEVIQRALKG
jgi:hypothetical protein